MPLLLRHPGLISAAGRTPGLLGLPHPPPGREPPVCSHLPGPRAPRFRAWQKTLDLPKSRFRRHWTCPWLLKHIRISPLCFQRAEGQGSVGKPLVVNKSPAGSWFAFCIQRSGRAGGSLPQLLSWPRGSPAQKSVFLLLSGPVFQKDAPQCPQLSLALDTADRQVLIIENSTP